METKTISPKEVLPGQILYANLNFVNAKRQKLVAKEQIISREYDKEMKFYFDKENDRLTLEKWKLPKEDKLTLVSLDVLAELGFKNR